VAHFEWTSFAETCSPLLRVWEFPVALSCHGSEVFVDHADRAELFSSVEAVHCVSRAVERAAHTGGLDEGRAQVIPSAVDPDVFRPPAEPPLSGGRYVVVTVGALRWVKGYEYALDTIARVAERGVPVRYEIVGSEPDESGDRRRIEVAVRELGIGAIVRLHGALSEPEIVRLLQRADVFLQASLSEGMPTAVLEAMACGLAVVATDVGGTREVLTTGVEGLLVAPRDSAAAADALAALWDESHRRRLLGAAARARATRFTLESQLAAFETFYKDLVA
jgi:glycosyltransferase involved in cell wall biosynthesis